MPILNNKYWNQAMREKGYESKTVVEEVYSINKKDDFDVYLPELPYGFWFWHLRFLKKIAPVFFHLHKVNYIAKNFDILNIPFSGGALHTYSCWQKELDLYLKLGKKIVVIAYGADYQMYSKLYSKSWHYGLLYNYPRGVFNEEVIEKKIKYLSTHAHGIMTGFQFDQLPRWDIMPYAVYPMDCRKWQARADYTNHDGKNGIVNIIHTPNHRAIKGTEFIIKAVNELKAEGLLCELILMEKIPNDTVHEIMQTKADILVEQLLLSYALSAIEGMASGLPVIANLDDNEYTRVFRRFSYLNECPILSGNPENIKETLRLLITKPELRKELGEAGRNYAVKYHSFEAMQNIFEAIYDKVWYNKQVDLLGFFNPNNADSYNNKSPYIKHPLQENKFIEKNK
jgi:glycosyltransferase involved in cell wall biosynthesis